MPFIGSIIPHRIAGMDPKAQRLRRERDERREVARPGDAPATTDAAELSSVEELEAPEAPRESKAPESEEGREDRERLGYYGAEGRVPPPSPPRIDVEG